MRKRFNYTKDNLKEISFPIGGIGTGCIGLSGNGRLIDWEIFNRPNKNSYNGYSFFAIRAEKNEEVIYSRVLNGRLQPPYSGKGEQDNRFGTGVERESMAGFSHFDNVSFTGRYPIAEICFKGNDQIADIKLTAFNPFIPLNEKDSSLPAAIFFFDVTNKSKDILNFTLVANIYNPHTKGSKNIYYSDKNLHGLDFFSTAYYDDDPEFGQLSIATDGEKVSHQTYLYRGRWFDAMTMLWKEFSQPGKFNERIYNDSVDDSTTNRSFVFRDAGIVANHITVKPMATRRVTFILTWFFPNFTNYWNPGDDKDKNGNIIIPKWKNYYATLFGNAREVNSYLWKNLERLCTETKTFRDTLFSSTLPSYVLDAISGNMSTLKSPTCLRLTDGTFYGFEGSHAHNGSCEGSCTHVWNYDQTTAFLFPALMRSQHELYYKYNFYESGKMMFRTMLPPEKTRHLLPKNNGPDRAAVDGQMGTVLRVFREWQLSGDDLWLKRIWSRVKKSLEYAWSKENEYHWDSDMDGVMEGQQHHTLDVEMFGPNSYLTGMYQAALLAAHQLALVMDDLESAKLYLSIYKKGNPKLSTMYNGEYFHQLIDIKNTKGFPIDKEIGEVKNQIGEGCHIDQVLGQWHAHINNLGYIFDKKRLRSALLSIYKYNFHSMKNFENPCRIFALDDEKGVVNCTWPHHNAPKIPVPYSTECFYGSEYQFACQMIFEGLVTEGLDVVKNCRKRFDGKKRNPWNEFESGSNYVRSMAAYSLLIALSGFKFNHKDRMIGFDPRINAGKFRCFWSCGCAWGEYIQNDKSITLNLLSGELSISQFLLPQIYLGRISGITIKNNILEYLLQKDKIVFKHDIKLSKSMSMKIFL
jgi:uncharacterized protein (DUF608 family)